MGQLTRIGLLSLGLVFVASMAGATVQTRALVGPLNKAASGRILCEATLRIGPAPEGIILTLYDKTGAVATTSTFPGLGVGDIVSIQVGPGQANSYLCIAESSSVEGVELTLSHINSLSQSTATVGEPRRVPPRTTVSVAGPLTPGLQRKVVCKGSAENATNLTFTITDENGTSVATAVKAVNAMGTAEITANAGYNKRYLCTVACGQAVNRVQATIESRDSLGTPVDADEGSPQDGVL